MQKVEQNQKTFILPPIASKDHIDMFLKVNGVHLLLSMRQLSILYSNWKELDIELFMQKISWGIADMYSFFLKTRCPGGMIYKES